MKRNIIAALVGGIIIFIWQLLSWVMLNLHEPAQQYTDKQESILQNLSQLEEGGYLMPRQSSNASREEMEAMMKSMEGKPWAVVYYHKAWESDMAGSIFRSVITDIIAVLLLCIILSGFARLRFANVFVASLLTGLIVFLNAPYTQHIWYETFDITAHLADALVGWGLCGLWLGWYLGRNRDLAVDR